MGSVIPDKQIKILHALAKYKFLTRKQMIRLGIASKNSNLNSHCMNLVKGDLIGEIDAKHYGIGFVYYMKEKGAFNIRENDDNRGGKRVINRVKNPPKLQASTLWHRVQCIWCQIELDISASKHNYPIGLYKREIDTQGSMKAGDYSKATTLYIESKILEPDACFLVNDKLFAFEFEHQTYTARSFEKLKLHCEALFHKSVGKKYGLKKGERYRGHRVLCVYEKPEVMKNVMKKCLSELNEEYLNGWFLFKNVHDLLPILDKDFNITQEYNYFDNWTNLQGEKVNILS